jgi:hypothetical protein
LRTETSLLNPEIDVQTTGVINANYAYIEEFGRYYEVKDIISIRNNIWRLKLKVDVLFSYKDAIGELPCIVSRTSSDEYISKDLNDNQIPILSTYETEIVYNEPLKDKLISNITGSDTDSDLCFVVTMVQPLDIAPLAGSWNGNLLSKPCANLSGNTPFSCCFILSHKKLQQLADAIIKNSEAASYIISVRSLPLSVLLFSTTRMGTMKYYDNEGNEHVLLEDVNYIPNVVDDTGVNSTSYVVKAHQKINVNRKYNDYRDFAPYTTYELFLPYYGNYQLKESDIYNGLYYDIMLNFSTGQLIYGFYRDKGNDQTVDNPNIEYIETINVTLGIEIPISATNYQEIIRSNESKTIAGVGGLVASIISLIAGTVLTLTGVGSGLGAALVVGGMTGSVSSGANMAANLNSIPNVSATGSRSNNSVGVYLPTNLILVRKIKNCTDVPSNISNILGLPSMKYIDKISLLGDSKILYVYDCHLDNIITSVTEKDEILTKLKSGVIT